MALRIAPGLFRDRFGFESWPDFDDQLWQDLRTEAKAQQRSTLLASIGGSDRNPSVIKQASVNAHNCGVADQVWFAEIELQDVTAPATEGVLMCNPPYGERLGQDEDLEAFYKQLGQVLKQRFKGWTVFVLSGNKAIASAIGLKSSQRFAVYNGDLPCQLLKYELY